MQLASVSGAVRTFGGRSLAALDQAVLGLVEKRIRVAIWIIVAGFVLLVASLPLNVATVLFEGKLQNGFNAFLGVATSTGGPPVATKEVGFLSALNWSLFCTCVAPAVVWFALSAVGSFDTTLSRLCDQGMVRDASFNRISYPFVQAQWVSHMRSNRILFAFVFISVLIFVMHDWWSVVGSPILDSGAVRVPVSDPQMEYDWSVASIFAGSSVNAAALLAFGFVCYLMFAGLVPALAIAVTLCTVYYMAFLTTLRAAPGAAPGGALRFAAVPTPSPRDRHFGFKAFADLFHNFLLMSLAVLFGLWLMAVQNIYLRDLGSADIYSFVLGEVGQYEQVLAGSTGWVEFLAWFVTPARFLIYNMQVALSALLFPFICVLAVLGCWFVLRTRAREAQDLSLQHTAKLAVEFQINEETLRERLQNDMDVWPVGWITSRKLIALMFLLFASLVSYRLIVIPLIFVGFAGIGRAAQILFVRD